MNFKTTLLLLLLLVIVGGFFLLWQDQPTTREIMESTDQARTADGVLVFDAVPQEATVASITIEKDEKRIVLEKDGSDWKQVAPVTFPLNSWSVDSLVRDIGELRYAERFEPGRGENPPLEKLKLAPPEAVVTVDYSGDAASRVLRLGRKAVGGRGYALVGDATEVYVVTNAVHEAVLDEGVEDWRKKSLTSPSESNVTRIELKSPADHLELLKHEGQWAFAGEHSGRVDSAEVRSLLSGVGSVIISRFAAENPDDLSLYGLDKPRTVLLVQQADAAAAASEGSEEEAASTPAPELKDVLELWIGSPTDLKGEQLHAMLARNGEPSEVVFVIAKSAAEKFEKKAEDLRDPAITPIKVEDVTAFGIAPAEGDALRFKKELEGWAFADEAIAYGADAAAVADALRTVVQAKGTEFVPDAQPEGEPLVVVTLEALGRSAPDVLKFFEAPAAQPKEAAEGDEEEPELRYLVLRNSETTGYIVEASELQETFETPRLTYRARDVWDLDEAKLSKVTLTRPDGTVFEFSREVAAAESDGDAEAKPEPAAWSLAGHDRFEADAFEKLIDVVISLDAETWLGGEATLEGDVYTVVLQQGEMPAQTLRVDVDAARATAQGVDAAFTVGQDVVEALTAEYRPRLVLDVADDAISSVTITRGEQAIRLVREDGTFKIEGGAEADADAVAALVDTLAGLRAESFVKAPAESEPLLSITVATKDDVTHEIRLVEAGDQTLVASGDRWFTVSAEALSDLQAPLVKAAAEEPEGD